MTEIFGICVAGELRQVAWLVGQAIIPMPVPPIFLITVYQMKTETTQTSTVTAATTDQEPITTDHIHHRNHPASLVFRPILISDETVEDGLQSYGLIGPQVS
jgi:hypothetical protein